MLEAIRKRHKPRVAVRQSKETCPEDVLGIRLIRLFQEGEPFVPQGLEFIIGSDRNLFEVDGLESNQPRRSERIDCRAYLVQTSRVVGIAVDLGNKGRHDAQLGTVGT